jgi:phage regulator Rha-like protein
MDNLLTVIKDEIYVATDILAKELERKHQTITKLINEYENELKKLGILRFEIEETSTRNCKKEKRGQPKKFYYLNKKQYIFLITNMRTKANEKSTIMKAKLEIADKFVEMEKALLQIQINRQNQEWLETRKQGKIARKEFTDMLKKLLEMTKETHPESTYVKKPNLLYSNFTRMIYKNLFEMTIKIKNPRNSMTECQLISCGAGELAAMKNIQKLMDENKDAKEIYKLTNEKIEAYAEIVGKSTIIDLISSKQISMLEGDNNGKV